MSGVARWLRLGLRGALTTLYCCACGAARGPRAVPSPAPGATSAASACEPRESQEPRPASTVAPPALPTPELKLEAIRAGDAYTVWGVSYYLRNPQHRKEVAGRNIAVTGFITKTNLPDAPACAVHRRGQADPDNCMAKIPTFWLGDRPDAAEADCIKVMGWASNYAQIYDAIKQFDRPRGATPFTDDLWAVKLPNPLPVAGAKVTVRGNYGDSFAKASSGVVVDVSMGLLTYLELEYLQTPAELATLPGVKRRQP